MFFNDLSRYAYIASIQGGNDLNIGWLSREHPFPVGKSTAEFRRGLNELASEPVNCCMGSHECDLCTPLANDQNRWRKPIECQISVASGNGEIRVPSLHGDAVFVAPQLVAHYVEAHDYLPPPQFIEAAEVFAQKRRTAWEALRAEWRERFPPLDGKWTHWRLYSHGWLISIVARDDLARAIERVEYFYRIGFSVGVSRGGSGPDGQGGAVETTLKTVSECHPEIMQEIADSFISQMRDPSVL